MSFDDFHMRLEEMDASEARRLYTSVPVAAPVCEYVKVADATMRARRLRAALVARHHAAREPLVVSMARRIPVVMDTCSEE